jgi:hypothetical protein
MPSGTVFAPWPLAVRLSGAGTTRTSPGCGDAAGGGWTGAAGWDGRPDCDG